MDRSEIENKIKSEATSVLVRVVLFIVYYIVWKISISHFASLHRFLDIIRLLC